MSIFSFKTDAISSKVWAFSLRFPFLCNQSNCIYLLNIKFKYYLLNFLLLVAAVFFPITAWLSGKVSVSYHKLLFTEVDCKEYNPRLTALIIMLVADYIGPRPRPRRPE